MSTQSIISTEILNQINELLFDGAKIEKITSDAELANSVALKETAKRVRLDTEIEKEKVVTPLMDVYVTARDEYSDKIKALKELEKNIANKGGDYQADKQKKIDAENERLRIEEQKRIECLLKIEQDRIAEEESLRKEANDKLDSVDLMKSEVVRLTELGLAKKELYMSETDNVKRQTLLLEMNSLRESVNELGAKITALTSEATTAHEVADIAIDEAVQAAQQVYEALPVQQVQMTGPKVKEKYSAVVTDFRAALKYLVDNGEWAYLEGTVKFREVVQSACDKMASSLQKNYKVTGSQWKVENLLR